MPFLIALGIAVALTPIASRLGAAIGLVDRAGGNSLKIHRRSVPVLGGLAVLGSVLAALSAAGASFSWTVAGAAGLALCVGLLDDAHPLPAWVQALAAAAAGSVLAAGGDRLEAFGSFGAIATVLLTAACAIGVNLVDGQDGLAGGLAAIAALGLAGLASGAGVGLALALAGALVGFLVWNRPPARIFLGNGGAYAVGVMLAAAAADGRGGSDARGLLAAAACLGVFMFELTFTLLRRLRSGSALLAGDRLHTYDLLAARSGSRTASTIALCAVGAVASALGLLFAAVPLVVAGSLAGITAAFAAFACAHLWSFATQPRRKVGRPAAQAD